MLQDSDFIIPDHRNTGVKTHLSRKVFAVPTFAGVLPEAGTFYADLTGLFKPGSTNMGLSIQSSVALTVNVTMASAEEVRRSPDGVLWHADVAVPATNITALVDASGNVLFGSVLKVTCLGAGRLYIATL